MSTIILKVKIFFSFFYLLRIPDYLTVSATLYSVLVFFLNGL